MKTRIYQELKEKYPEKIEEIYIHNVDNEKKLDGHRRYWTAFDLGLYEFKKDGSLILF